MAFRASFKEPYAFYRQYACLSFEGSYYFVFSADSVNIADCNRLNLW